MNLELEYLELLHLISSVSKNKIVSQYLNCLKRHHEPTFIHSLHVATLAVQIGYEYGLSLRRLRTLANAALLHDIGKCNIPISIMDKPSALSAEEFEIVRRHPIDAYELVNKCLFFEKRVKKDMVEKVCLMHHIKLDGSGYPLAEDGRPQGIDYSNVPEECRIVTVCDIYDALIEKRPYKKCFSHIEAIQELERMSQEGQIDVAYVDILKKLIDENRLILQTTALDMRYA